MKLNKVMKGRPIKSDYHPYFETYVSKVEGENILQELQDTAASAFYKSIPEDAWDNRYEEGKWSIKEVLMHIMDTERIFGYRALRISRHDRTPVAGFDQDIYVPHYNVDNRSINSLLAEYHAVRENTKAMFSNFSEDQFKQVGVASDNNVSVHALAFLISGHETHHIDILKNKYL